RVRHAEPDVQLAVGPFRRAGPQDDVGGKERPEQHDFRREEQPDAQLAVRQPGVGPLFDCVRNVHDLCVLCILCVLRVQAFSGSNCGLKSLAAPGTLYSYGPRYTMGSVRKLPCPGGDGADHSSVVASHGFLSVALPHFRLLKKLMMNGIWKRPRPQAPKPMT